MRKYCNSLVDPYERSNLILDSIRPYLRDIRRRLSGYLKPEDLNWASSSAIIADVKLQTSELGYAWYDF